MFIVFSSSRRLLLNTESGFHSAVFVCLLVSTGLTINDLSILYKNMNVKELEKVSRSIRCSLCVIYKLKLSSPIHELV